MRIQVLDHGYIEFVEAWGTGKEGRLQISHDKGSDVLPTDYEVGIIEAARQSTQGNFRGWERDMKLLTYLWEHRHNSPFEFAGCTIEVQAPLFVFREWHRHRTQSYNEMSARYTPLPDVYYRPDVSNVYDRSVSAVAAKNKQAGTIVSTAPERWMVKEWLEQDAKMQVQWEQHYLLGLNLGIPKEIARIGMPVSHFSRMRATANLRNWLAFLTLRMDPNAQWEIRQYANAFAEKIVASIFPRTWWLFNAPHREEGTLRERIAKFADTLANDESYNGDIVEDLRALLTE